MKRIEAIEPWIFIFFGVFHLHRIWGLIDRTSYAEFWLGVMENRSAFYYVLMTVLIELCMAGMITFFKNLHNNFWWRWIYILCGGYVLFDLCAIMSGLEFWNELIVKMFDTAAPYWNLLWGMFIVMGGISLVFGISLLRKLPKSE